MKVRQVTRHEIALLSMLFAIFAACSSRESPDARIIATGEALRDKIASRLNLSKDWGIIRKYIYCEIAIVGTERKVVEAKLNQIADLAIDEYPGQRTVEYRFVDGAYLPYLEFFQVEYDDEWQVMMVYVVHYSGSTRSSPQLVMCANSSVSTPGTK